MTTLDGLPQQPKGFPTKIDPTTRDEELAILVCSGALRLRKEKGLQRVLQTDITHQIDHRPSDVEKGVTAALQRRWLIRQEGHLALTATGIYIAKQALNLPR